jgi:predicted DCC family thiol-disulfide oxidoreductase YuxK
MREETVLFDGDCGVCSYAVLRIAPLLPASVVFRAHQSFDETGLAALGTTRLACTQRVQFVNASGIISSGGAACTDLLERSTTPLRRLAFIARLPILRSLVNVLYDCFAANRATISRTFGLTACRLPIARDGTSPL